MRNSDEFDKIKKGNRCLLEWLEILRMNERQYSILDYGPDSRFLGCFRDLRALRTYKLLCFAIILRRGMKACTSKKTRSVLPS